MHATCVRGHAAGALGSIPSDGAPTKASIGEGQGWLKEGDTWRPATTICGLTVGWCMLLLLGVVVLVSTTLAIVLPQQPLSELEMTASIWRQGVGVYERGFQLEVSLDSVLFASRLTT